MTDARAFHLILIKPTHYDDDGYPIQWWRAGIPSNSLACLYGLALDCAERRVLGEDVAIEIDAYDEQNAVVPLGRIARRIGTAGGKGLVCMVGVQSNQFPRAMHIARRLRAAGVPVAIGGFHVSGVLAMLPEPTPELKEAMDLGISLFAGEAEGRLEEVLRDADAGRLRPLYQYMDDLPDLRYQVIPFLPRRLVKRYANTMGSFDGGRGCPFQCSFCTIINVQGRKSRWRDADDVERIVRANAAQDVMHYFITDDNFARNRNWEAIFDRLIELRERDGLKIRFLIQVDTMAHRIPRFVEKAARAGCVQAFIGLENINPDNLLAAKKKQNKIAEYRKMFQIWRAQGVVTYAGFILGFPGDTAETITRDIRLIQQNLPVDFLEFTVLTPLPGSEDHQKMFQRGEWMDPDLNRYDLEHATFHHARLSGEELEAAYAEAWRTYYSDAHIELLMRRAMASGIKPIRILQMVIQIGGVIKHFGVHPQQGGYWRRKLRTERRPSLPREPWAPFHAKRAWEVISVYSRLGYDLWRLDRLRKRIQRDPEARAYTDEALAPLSEAEERALAETMLSATGQAA